MDILELFRRQSPLYLFLLVAGICIRTYLPELAWKKKKALSPPAISIPTLTIIYLKTNVPARGLLSQKVHE